MLYDLKKKQCSRCKKTFYLSKKSIEIGQYKNDQLLATFDCIADAQRETGITNIAYVIRGERQSAGGYEWNSL